LCALITNGICQRNFSLGKIYVMCYAKTVIKIKMAAMKTSPGLVNFFIYNSTFGPKEGMVCDMILEDYALLWLQNLAAFNIGIRSPSVPKLTWRPQPSHFIQETISKRLFRFVGFHLYTVLNSSSLANLNYIYSKLKSWYKLTISIYRCTFQFLFYCPQFNDIDTRLEKSHMDTPLLFWHKTCQFP